MGDEIGCDTFRHISTQFRLAFTQFGPVRLAVCRIIA